jgi:hypothetical protein
MSRSHSVNHVAKLHSGSRQNVQPRMILCGLASPDPLRGTTRQQVMAILGFRHGFRNDRFYGAIARNSPGPEAGLPSLCVECVDPMGEVRRPGHMRDPCPHRVAPQVDERAKSVLLMPNPPRRVRLGRCGCG